MEKMEIDYSRIPGSLDEEPKAILLNINGKGKTAAIPWFPIKNALIDTGASFCAIPKEIFDYFEIYGRENKYILGTDNIPIMKTFYVIMLKIFNFELFTEACLIEYPLFIIGRDILKNFRLVANGVDEKFELI